MGESRRSRPPRICETRECLCLELDGRAVAERFVEPGVVEPADPFDDRELELGPGAPDAVGDQLGLEGVHEALGQRVVVGVADRPDRAQHPVIVEDLLEGEARVLGGFTRSSQYLDESRWRWAGLLAG